MTAFIEVRELKKDYHLGEEFVHALAGVSIDIPKGEFAAFVGPSGSGKSTLLHLIGGLDTPSSGSITVDGHDLSRASDKELAVYRNRNIGFVFQAFHLHPTYTALENVAIPLLFSGTDKTERLSRARIALEAVDLSQRTDHRPNQLSGGERQRVSIARALVTNPSIIVADEPTGNLDSVNGVRIMELLGSLNREHGITLIVATHDAELARRARRVVTLRDGLFIGDTRAV
ncbi:ABC transporter ATP-binding protein [Dehalogenimonas etheniformans]|uniref:ABC transporter ATP-binding protein n=1 Tax=Dehalogenimonas etheniformans TaxID=1536648 RepID=A0A2P5P5M1_9CHLR|nr:ABC transporter ATP-binding protein [Dehalogenimonas etheniformans]PPD57593.1 ABC transporter ATP-binding protein [Dehalogenimonas etheniformans]QNT75933.1 ABC transporter ATP-binding protein [Dehalogenimonas etheniformans]